MADDIIKRLNSGEGLSGDAYFARKAMKDGAKEIALLRAVAGSFLDEQTEANADALRRILTEQVPKEPSRS